MKVYDRDRGSAIMGTKGTVVIDRDGYDVYDWKGKQIDTFRTGKITSSSDTLGIDTMTDAHFANFIAAIKGESKAQFAHPGRQHLRHHAAALEHRLFHGPHPAHRHRKRPHPQRSRSHEALGPRIRKRMGSHRLKNPGTRGHPAQASRRMLLSAGLKSVIPKIEELL